MTVDISLFGSLKVRMGDRELGPKDFMGRKPKQLLEILLLHEGRPVPKDQLAEKLWGESLPVNFSASLEHYVSLLRKRLDPGGRLDCSMVRTVHGGYRFEAADLQVDVMTFDRIYERHVLGEASRADLETAVALVQGDLLEDEPYADWAAGPRAVYAQRHVELLVAAAHAALAAGDGVGGAELATAAVTRDGYAEPAHRLLMLAHYVQGRQSAALAAFDRCREALTGELGVDPLPETTRLHAAILQQAPAHDLLVEFVGAPRQSEAPVLTQVRPRVAMPAPRRSSESVPPLLPFVGRDREMAALIGAVTHETAGASASVVLLDGQPGSGKSRTLNELARHLDNRTVVRLTATAAEHTLAGAAISHLLATLCAGNPKLEDVLEALPSAWDGTPAQRAGVVNRMLVLVLEHSPFTVLFDSAENIDDLSAQMFACLAMRLPANSAAFVFACRSSHLAGSHVLATTLNVTRVTLEPLSEEALAVFGLEGLHERTGGLPLFVAREVVPHSSGTETSREEVLDRFRQLGERLFHLCVVAAILREPIRPEPLARIVGRDAVEVVDDLERLCGLQVLQVAGEGFAFRNHAIKDLLASTASPARRQLLQGRTRASEAQTDRRGANRLMPAAQNRRAGQVDRRAVRRSDEVDYADLRTASAS
ncbi:MAG: hypothetical protein QOI54_85 [Actinomycetota bacterium]|jgi:DNA-binding SARP family transcriptional activator|nr:hypothetical protein [Actinomycetota bacterium]